MNIMDRTIGQYAFSTFQWRTIVWFLILTSALCLEESERAIFLSPRNFNYHPYEANPQVVENRGPVVFPPSPPSADDNQQSNVIVVPTEDATDGHPYPKVARKHKHRVAGRFNSLDNQLNPQVYEALSIHASKVLSKPPSQLGKDHVHLSRANQRKNYAFSYKVVDHLTGDDFSHTQSQDSRATNGEYRVKLPDGRVQIVSYIADKNGYKADVKYMADDEAIAIKANAPYHQEFNDDRQHRPAAVTVLYNAPIRPTPQPNSHIVLSNYDDEGYYKPVYYDARTLNDYVTSSQHRYQDQPKVEIYSGNQQINSGFDDYVDGSGTGSRYLYNGRENFVSSTAVPDLGRYDPSSVYVNDPKFTIIQNHQHQQNDRVAYGK